MAITVSTIEKENFGSASAVVFKAVMTTSAETLLASDCGLEFFLAVQPAGGGGIDFTGASPSTTGTLTRFTAGTASSGTVYGVAIGK